jgi:hypothetical protein
MMALNMVLPLAAAIVLVGAATVRILSDSSSSFNPLLRNWALQESQRSLMDVVDLRLFDDDFVPIQAEDTSPSSSSSNQPFNPGFDDAPVPTPTTDTAEAVEVEDDDISMNATNTTNLTNLDASTNETMEEYDDDFLADPEDSALEFNTTAITNTTNNITSSTSTSIPNEDDTIEDLDSELIDDGGMMDEVEDVANATNFTTYYDDDEMTEGEITNDMPIFNETANMTMPSNISYYDDDGVTTLLNGTTTNLTNASNSTGDDDDMMDEEEPDVIEEDATAMPSATPTAMPSFTPTLSPTSPKLTRAPTLAPTSKPSSSPSSSPTYEAFGPIDYVGNNAEGYFAPYPLGVCQGDCDTDQDVRTFRGSSIFGRHGWISCL